MKGQYQSIVLDMPETGDCTSACIASILELSLDMVPHYGSPTWIEQVKKFNNWLKDANLYLQYCLGPGDYTDGSDIEITIPKGYSIMIVDSSSDTRKASHAIVALDGEAVFDPTPKELQYPIEKLIVIRYLAFAILDPSKSVQLELLKLANREIPCVYCFKGYTLRTKNNILQHYIEVKIKDEPKKGCVVKCRRTLKE